MNGGEGADDNVWLPSGAPKELHEFLDGDSSSVEIDTTAIRWLPPPIDAPVLAEPSVTIRPGSTPTTVTIEVAWSRAGPTSAFQVVIVDGRLRVTSSELAPSAARRVSAWVAAFNRELSVSDRQLDSLRVQGQVLIVTTRSPLPPPRASSMTPVPVALAGLLALRRPPTSAAPWRRRTQAAKLLSATAIFLIICGGAAVVTAALLDDTIGDGDSQSSDESTTVPTTSSDSTTTLPPGPCASDSDAEEGVAACPPVPPSLPPTTIVTSTASSTISTSSTTSTSTTSTSTTTSTTSTTTTSTTPTTPTTSSTSSTSSTTLPADPCATDPDAEVATCGPTSVPGPGGGGTDDEVQCVDPDVPADVNNDGITDRCIDVYTEVIPPTGGLPTQHEAVPPRPIPATGSDSNVPLQLGVLLILAGLIALVAGHRRAGDENS
jgi:hypothetical protein